MKNKELLPPKMDIVFQALFRKGNETITKAFISQIIGKNIQKIELDKNKNLLREYAKDKMGILDLIAILDDGVICNIEVQLSDNKDIEKRILYYNGKTYSQQMLVGDKYKDLNQTISIAILDYKLKKTINIKEAHTIWHIQEDNNNIKLTDVLEIHIIEIPKIREVKERQSNNALIDWITFLDNPNQKEVSEIMKTNKEIQEAMEKLEEISSDEELMRLVELRRKAILDENQAKYAARVVGREEGRKEEKIEVAKKLLKMNIELEKIIEITELTKEEVEKLTMEEN